MPDGTSFDVPKIVHARHPGLPCAAMTGDHREDVRRQIEAAGFVSIIHKPFDMTGYPTTVLRLVHRVSLANPGPDTEEILIRAAPAYEKQRREALATIAEALARQDRASLSRVA